MNAKLLEVFLYGSLFRTPFEYWTINDLITFDHLNNEVILYWGSHYITLCQPEVSFFPIIKRIPHFFHKENFLKQTPDLKNYCIYRELNFPHPPFKTRKRVLIINKFNIRALRPAPFSPFYLLYSFFSFPFLVCMQVQIPALPPKLRMSGVTFHFAWFDAQFIMLFW